MALIQRMGVDDKPHETSHCPRCKRDAPYGKLGMKFVGRSWDYLSQEYRGPYCKFCAVEILHEHLPKLQFT